MKKTFVALAASLALSTAFAQSSAPAAPAAPAGASAPDTARGQAREARVEQRISELHTKLKITPAQDEQWNKFADVMRDHGWASLVIKPCVSAGSRASSVAPPSRAGRRTRQPRVSAFAPPERLRGERAENGIIVAAWVVRAS